MNTEEDKLAVGISEEITHKRGRLEYRKTFVYNNIEEISPEWVGLKRLIRVERLVVYQGKKDTKQLTILVAYNPIMPRSLPTISEHIGVLKTGCIGSKMYP